MKKIFTIVIGFIHDFAAGCWAASVLAVYWLDRATLAPEVLDVLTPLKKQFFWTGIICVFIVFATGAGRTFTYVDNVYGPDAERRRRRLLVIKHLLLMAVFGLGIFWQYTMVFR